MIDAASLRPLVDALIAFTLVETLLLAAWFGFKGRKPLLGALLPGLCAGLLLMVALRCALTPGAGYWMLACIAGSGLCHVLDLRRHLHAKH